MSEGVHYRIELAIPANQVSKWKVAKIVKYTYKDWGELDGPYDGQIDDDMTVAESLAELGERTYPELPSELVDKGGSFLAAGSLEGEDFDDLFGAVSTAVRAAGNFGATGGVTYAFDEIGGGTRIVVGPVPKKKATSFVRDATDEEIAATAPKANAKKAKPNAKARAKPKASAKKKK